MNKYMRKTTIVSGLCLAVLLFLNALVLAQGTLFVEGDKVGIGIANPSFDLHLVNATTSANLWIEGASSGAMEFVDGDAPVDHKAAQFLSNNGKFFIRGINDAATGQTVTGIVLHLGNGDVGVGTTAPARRLEVEDGSTTGSILRLQNADGTCDLDPNTGGLTWSCSSDLRLKADVQPADTVSVLNNLLQMGLYDYEVTASGERRLGFIAQRLQETHPDRVSSSEDGTLMVRQPETAELLGAVQALYGMVTDLRQEVAELKGELEKERER